MFLHQIFYQGLKARISSWPTLVLGESSPLPHQGHPSGPWHCALQREMKGPLQDPQKPKKKEKKLAKPPFLEGNNIFLVLYLLFPLKMYTHTHKHTHTPI